MNDKRIMRVGLGVVGVCLLLVIVLRPLATHQLTVQASGTGEDNAAVYLPLILRLFSSMTTLTTTPPTYTPTATNTLSPTSTSTPAFTPTATDTSTATITPTFTPMPTNPPTPTNTPTPTLTPTPTATNTFTTTRVSVASDGTQGNYGSWSPSISADGRYIAFISYANNLVPGDTNDVIDVFVHDRQTGQTSRVSLASDGAQGNGDSIFPAISGDGRYIAFHSAASNLVSDDTNGLMDVFIHDRQTGQTSRVSVASDGTEGNADSNYPSISADGRYIAFDSEASNLVNGDTNYRKDVFVYDQQTGQTTRVSVASSGTEGNHSSLSASVSADGRYIAFHSLATNLVSGDTNNTTDVFIHDQQTGQTTRISLTSDGAEANGGSWQPSVSADGRYVAFSSYASNLVSSDTNGEHDVFVHDRQTGHTTRVSVSSDGVEGDGGSWDPRISANGQFVTFGSSATNLVTGDTGYEWDIFVHDQLTAEVYRVSIASNGSSGNDGSWHPSISGNGRFVTFQSYASNLVSDDTNGTVDVFVHDRGE